MGVVESITHSEEIENILSRSEKIFSEAKNRMYSQNTETENTLKKLGHFKLEAWDRDIIRYIDAFNKFNNLEAVYNIQAENYKFLKNINSQEFVLNVKEAQVTVKEYISDGALAIGTGALVGIAAAGGIQYLAASSSASVGAAVGLAKKGRAALAGGLVALPVIIGVGGLIAAAKGKKRLASAKKVMAEAEKKAAEMDSITIQLKGIEQITSNYFDFLCEVSRRLGTLTKEINGIAKFYGTGLIDYDSLTEIEQRTLHVSWLFIQLYYNLLGIRLIDENGEVSPRARQVLGFAKSDYTKINAQNELLIAEKTEIKDNLCKSKAEFLSCWDMFSSCKKRLKSQLVSIAKAKISFFSDLDNLLHNSFDKYNNIDFRNIFYFPLYNDNVELIYEAIQVIGNNSIEILSGKKELNQQQLYEIAWTSGLHILSNLELDSYNEFTLWIDDSADELDYQFLEDLQLGKNETEEVRAVVDSISGRETLLESKNIYSCVSLYHDKVQRIYVSLSSLDERFIRTRKLIRRISRIEKKFARVISDITAAHSSSDSEEINYEALSDVEKRTLDALWGIVELKYCILTYPLIDVTSVDMCQKYDLFISDCEAQVKDLKKKVRELPYDHSMVVNCIWKQEMMNSFFISIAAVILMISGTILKLIHEKYMGLLWLVPIAIFGVGVYFLRQALNSKKVMYMRAFWIFDVVFIMCIEILTMVVGL